MTTLTDEELGTTSSATTYANTDQVYRGTFEGRLVGTATTAKQLETPFKLELQGDVAGNVDISGKQGVILQTTVSHATEADRAEYAGNTALATNANYADLANLANFAVESGKAKETEHSLTADRAYKADSANKDNKGNVIDETYALDKDLKSTKTELQNNINLVIQRIDKHEGSSAGSANARYAEKDMTDYFNTGALSTAIANNNFSELSVGNFIIKNVVVNGTTYSNVKFYLAHFDYYYNFGDTATTKHHVLILPATTLGTADMNDTNTTEGGYLNSKMRKTTLPLYSAGYQSAFGSAHILGWRNLVTTSVNKTADSSGYIPALGASQKCEWADAVCELMSESMVCGAPVWSSSGFDTGSLNQQLALFRFNTSAILANRKWYWLRNVHCSTSFCICDAYGDVAAPAATLASGVRPFALLI